MIAAIEGISRSMVYDHLSRLPEWTDLNRRFEMLGRLHAPRDKQPPKAL
jgi:DNA-binding CsgD family transcriptional regulator